MPHWDRPPERDPFRFDRFKPAIHRVESVGYDQRAGEVLDYLQRSLGQSKFLRIKYGLIDAQGTLDRLSRLESGWDSYGAEPPGPEAIRSSKEVLDQLAGDLILPSTIVPSAEGCVSIYFMTGDRTAFVESNNQGGQALVMYDRNGDVNVLEIGLDISSSEVGGRILAYLG